MRIFTFMRPLYTIIENMQLCTKLVLCRLHGMMESWKIGILGNKSDVGLILFSGPFHQH
ncbi:hypothetical protein D1AOALGA4SA_12528 [Olavius algarvensis Delta 1 endosymbiont]|nr:hypothetical protein D1AOALGA4SA_12528 [Olavius algarvensis Delta 1 endosymbiont]